MSWVDIYDFRLGIPIHHDEIIKHGFAARIERLHSLNKIEIICGSTPAIVWDLCKFYIDQMRNSRERCLKKNLGKSSSNI